MPSILKRLVAAALKVSLIATLAFCVIALVASVPSLHYSLLRAYSTSKVVKITTANGRSGGTGSHVLAPSGKTYILTNAHVCGVAVDGKVWVDSGNGRPIQRNVIEKADNTDLCLVEGLPGVTGLSVSRKEKIGEIVAVVGHPELMPGTFTRGELTGQKRIDVLISTFPAPPAPGTCEGPNKREETIFIFRVCVGTYNSYTSNIQILPGNSGSPVVDFYGQLVAVAFAGNQANWGFFVILPEIHEFLKPY